MTTQAVDKVMNTSLRTVNVQMSNSEMREFQDEFAQNNTEDGMLTEPFDELEAYGLHEIDPWYEQRLEGLLRCGVDVYR